MKVMPLSDQWTILYENAGVRVGNEFYIRGLMRRLESAQEPTVCCPQGTDHVRIRAQRLQFGLPPVIVPSFKLGWGSSQAIDPGGA